jgi:hypothetical protein
VLLGHDLDGFDDEQDGDDQNENGDFHVKTPFFE